MIVVTTPAIVRTISGIVRLFLYLLVWSRNLVKIFTLSGFLHDEISLCVSSKKLLRFFGIALASSSVSLYLFERGANGSCSSWRAPNSNTPRSLLNHFRANFNIFTDLLNLVLQSRLLLIWSIRVLKL